MALNTAVAIEVIDLVWCIVRGGLKATSVGLFGRSLSKYQRMLGTLFRVGRIITVM